MIFFSRSRSHDRTSDATRLVGCWHRTRADAPADGEVGVELEFRPDGTLHYAIDTGGRWQIARLTYHVEGDVLVTNQPSAPAQSRTTFEVLDDGSLLLDYEGERSWYRRGERRSPAV